MKITEEDLRRYIELFYSTLESTARDFLPEDIRNNILHLSLLPARIIGYVSTQFGVAIEYKPAETTHIQIFRGSARVEDLFVQAPRKFQDVGPILRIVGSNFRLIGGFLANGFPFRLDNEDAYVSFDNVLFRIKSWKREVHFAEVFGNRSQEYWSSEKAVSRAKDEVLAALVEVKRARDRNSTIWEYINKFKDKTILVLGDYDDDGLIRLDVIRRSLIQLGYDPLLIKDVPEYPHQDLPQKVTLCGCLSRFVVVDDSSKSGQLAEIPLCKNNNWVTILLHAEGQHGSWMTVGASYHSNVILEKSYNPASPDIIINIKEATDWAEQKLQELERKFNDTYPWRGMKRFDP